MKQNHQITSFCSSQWCINRTFHVSLPLKVASVQKGGKFTLSLPLQLTLLFCQERFTLPQQLAWVYHEGFTSPLQLAWVYQEGFTLP